MPWTLNGRKRNFLANGQGIWQSIASIRCCPSLPREQAEPFLSGRLLQLSFVQRLLPGASAQRHSVRLTGSSRRRVQNTMGFPVSMFASASSILQFANSRTIVSLLKLLGCQLCNRREASGVEAIIVIS